MAAGDANLTGLLDCSARRWPQKPALIEGEKATSYAELKELINALAWRFQSLRFSPGCRVGLAYDNTTNYVALTFALWQAQAVVVPIPTEHPSDEMFAIASTMQLEGIISQKPLGAAAALTAEVYFTELRPGAPDNHGLDLAFIRFTSGTTSARKGVALSHETVRERVESANRAFGIKPEDTIMWCLPMSHHFLITIVLYLSQGATIVLARHVVARPFLETVNRWGGSVLYAAPFHYALLARDRSGIALPTVRLAVATTCALPLSVAEDFNRRFGRPLSSALGVIELGLVSCNTQDPVGRWNSVGRPAEGVRVKIISPDANGCGEVAVSGPGFLDAYTAPWVARDQILTDGWFITDDLGRIDAEGYLFLVSRKTAVINLAGRKVFPEEIEAVLNRHPSVVESRVYGRPHPHLGEVVEADLVLAGAGTDLQSIRDLCRNSLASYQIPTRLNIVEALPRTLATGKLLRTARVG